MNIPIFKLEFSDDYIEKYQKGAKEVLSGKKIIEGKFVKKFENYFASKIGCKYAVMTNNCTSALTISLLSLNIKGKTVIIPSNTFFATAIACENAGNNIKLVDISRKTLSIDPESLEHIISKNRQDNENEIGAVVIVHIGGIISKDIKKIKEICKSNNIYLIEDAAHAHFSKLEDMRAGTIGDIASFSFFPTKVMTTGGGGIITTNNINLYDKCKSLKDFGRNIENIEICERIGINSQVPEMVGLMGCLELERVDERIKKRNELLDIYSKRLESVEFEVLKQEKGECCYYKCIVISKINYKFIFDYCKERNVTLTGKVYKIPVHKQPIFEKYDIGLLKNTELMCKNHFCPPLYPELTVDEVNYVCDVLIEGKNKWKNYNKYAMLTKINQIELFYEKIPQITNENELLIKIKGCGICGSDYHYYRHGGLGSFKMKLPLYIGHEPVGIIEDSKNKDYVKGSRIIIEPSYFCNSCKYCNKHRENVCSHGTFMGSLNERGAFSEYLIINKNQVFLLPDDMSYEIGILLEPLCVAYRTINITHIDKNDNILIIGAGPIGICTLILLRILGYTKISIYDRLEYRIAFSKKFKANKYYTNIDSISDKFNVCIDAVGCNEVFLNCQLLIDTLGKIIIVGIPEKEDYLQYNPHKLRIKESIIYNVRRGTGAIHDVLDLMKKNKDTHELIESIITHKYLLNDIDEAFMNSSNYKNESIKTIIYFK